MKTIHVHAHVEESFNPGGKIYTCNSFEYCISFQEVGSIIIIAKQWD